MFMRVAYSVARRSAVLGLVLFVGCLPVAAKKKSDTGTLETHVHPTRAGVFVDGKYLGPAANFTFARKYELTPGQHSLLLTEPRFEDYTTSITIEAGKTLKFERTLTPLPKPQPPFGQLRIIHDSKYDGVWINGKFMGFADEMDNPYQALLLPPGEYTVRIASPGGETKHEEKVTLTADKVTIVDAGGKK